jgi:outer membrane protein OmpA-like peptidoglycan-associated protein
MRNTIGIACALALVGCGGAAISNELRTARDTVGRARAGIAGRLEPDQLRAAERTLAEAETAPDGSLIERDLAYTADRQARIATVDAQRVALHQRVVADQRTYEANLRRLALERRASLEQRTVALEEVRRELARVRRELELSTQTLGRRSAELEQLERSLASRERELLDSEQRASEAMRRLREVENIREEQDRTIITLGSEVLFETGSADLRPGAHDRLRAIAAALEHQPDRQIIIEGHTDARGNDASNERLSRARAEAVERFLLDNGVPSARIRAFGRGESEPIADNRSPEGRAENRRVEIEIAPRA